MSTMSTMSSMSSSLLLLQPVIGRKMLFSRSLVNDALEGLKRDFREKLLQTLLVRLC